MSILVKNLIHILKSEGIAYCHWKSNAALDRSADGRNDLDILIERRDAAKFKQCVFMLGFKHAQAPYGPARISGIDDFFGFDFELGRFIHAQAHYCLVLGHDTTKNYRLPVERAFLESRSEDKDYGFPIPSPEWELLIFCFRMILKFSWISASLTTRYQLPASALDELRYLQDRINPEQIDQILAEHFPYVEKALFDECLQTLEPGTSKIQWGLVRYRLRSKLDGVSLRGPSHNLCLGMWRHLVNALRKRTGIGALKRQPMEGGLVIAVIGDDSTETVTLIAELKKWLGKAYHVQVISTQQQMADTLASTEDSKTNAGLGFGNTMKTGSKPFSVMHNNLLSRIVLKTILLRRMKHARRLAGKGVIVLLNAEGIVRLSLNGKSLSPKTVNLEDNCGDRMRGQMRSYSDETGIVPDLVIVYQKSIEGSSNRSFEQMKPSGEQQLITQPLVTYLEANAEALQRAKQFIWDNL